MVECFSNLETEISIILVVPILDGLIDLSVNISSIDNEIFSDVEGILGGILDFNDHPLQFCCKYECFLYTWLACSDGIGKGLNTLTKELQALEDRLRIILTEQLDSAQKVVDSGFGSINAILEILNSNATGDCETSKDSFKDLDDILVRLNHDL